jgi:hypothetical protein
MSNTTGNDSTATPSPDSGRTSGDDRLPGVPVPPVTGESVQAATSAEVPLLRVRLKAIEQFWYVLECIAFASGYLAKVSHKKALSEAGLAEMTGAEKFWYVLGCIAFGAAYFLKIPVKRAFEDAGLVEMRGAEQFWYILQCIAFAGGYFHKIPVKKALSQSTIPAK